MITIQQDYFNLFPFLVKLVLRKCGIHSSSISSEHHSCLWKEYTPCWSMWLVTLYEELDLLVMLLFKWFHLHCKYNAVILQATTVFSQQELVDLCHCSWLCQLPSAIDHWISSNCFGFLMFAYLCNWNAAANSSVFVIKVCTSK